MAFYLALDIGTKTIGLASSHGVIASGRGTYYFDEQDFSKAANDIYQIIVAEKVTDLIVGYPKNMNNTIGPRAVMVDDFLAILKSLLRVTINIHLVDERLTTRLSNQIMLEANLSRQKRKTKKDSLAAQLILETFLQQQENIKR
ncbi:Holliday junction resolvase-like protein [Spiroplasma syrphidicola EA-1]|uniref:Putative pre-16S rRNA nuclease n=1 Tax=Spiroplasma syrphidicola EA-1 TaxID=1276229 RepID=R4U420_9MOLU|nr:Holliday junction resolvase RuvX [Spiroplasma syrphidicola]AGM26177.1 Holliday junction resolvase-like protein [Spiroplasma syrphidicola EA-1]